MNRHEKIARRTVRNPAYRQAIERLDAALEKNTGSSNAEIIKLLRQTAFADVDELEKSGTLKLPE